MLVFSKHEIEICQLEDTLRRRQEDASSEVRRAVSAAREAHEAELAAVDERVRRAMAAKDENIARLAEGQAAALARLKLAEDMLEGLNRGLVGGGHVHGSSNSRRG